MILSILVIDSVIDLSILSTSKFSLYKLRDSIVGIFSSIFPNDFDERKEILYFDLWMSDELL